MLNNLIFSILPNSLYTLNVHFIYTKHTLIVHISKEKWEFLGRKAGVSRQESGSFSVGK